MTYYHPEALLEEEDEDEQLEPSYYRRLE